MPNTPIFSIICLLFLTSFSSSAPILGTEFSGGSFNGFVDISQGLRRWVNPINTSQNTPVDASGWPLGDAQTVVFDDRCFPGWNPPCDDPWSLQAPLNGTYSFNFTGNATLSTGSDPGEKGVFLSNIKSLYR